MGSYACDARNKSTNWQDYTEDDAMFAFAGIQIGGVPTCYTKDRTTYADRDWNLRVIPTAASISITYDSGTNEETIKSNRRMIRSQMRLKKKSTEKLRILAERLQDARHISSRTAIAGVSLEIKTQTNYLNFANTEVEKLTASNNILQTLPKNDLYNSREVLHLVKKFQSTQATHHK
jgi:hypothetical protein